METNNKETAFKEWLDKNKIKYTTEEGYEDVVILDNEYDLRNYESELLKLFPEIDFVWNRIPNHSSLKE